MKKNMYFDTNLSKINKDMYRPSSNLVRFVKSLLSVIMFGQSSITPTSISRRRAH
jgi:hypothetical protein